MKPLPMDVYLRMYREIIEDGNVATQRELCQKDLFFLLTFGCKRGDCRKQWIYERIREVENSPDGHLDLWAREHYKSTVITFAATIQYILNNPNNTIGIFSHTRPIAKSFLAQIKREFETNMYLKRLFPEILFANPHKESPKWSLDDGIIIKRTANPKESTVEAWGLVDGQPVSKHFNLMVYDDVVTRESVSSPDMINKVTEAWSMSLNLGGANVKKRYVGTRYHANDTYATMLQREAAVPRTYAATVEGTANGTPVLLTKEDLEIKFREMGSYVFSSQMLMNPMADKAMGFKTEWLEFWDVLRNAAHWNIYLIVDPAGEKKKDSDYTVMVVIALASDGNYYLVDGIRDRLNLTERTQKLFDLVRKWKPKVVGYEKYGMMSDIEHIKYVMQQDGYRFHIEPLGGAQPKNDRIRRLVPAFEQHRFFLPRKLAFKTSDDKIVDFTQALLQEEYDSFPVGTHDDMLDAMSRIHDEEMGAVFPKKVDNTALNLGIAPQNQTYDPFKSLGRPSNATIR
jgi:predicted phage terminase large subunit-like protein